MPDNYFDFSGLKTTRNRPYDADNLNYIYGRLRELGYDDMHIAVLLGTIAEESGGNPYAVSPDGKFQGLLQWAGDRYAINPFMEENPKRELDRQIDYIARTIDNLDDSKSWTHGGKGSGYNRAADAHEAYVSSDSLDAINHAFNRGYVRPTGGDDSVANRYKVAEQVYNIITNPQPVQNEVPEPTVKPPLRNAIAQRPEGFTIPHWLQMPQKEEYQPFYEVEPNIYRTGGKRRSAKARDDFSPGLLKRKAVDMLGPMYYPNTVDVHGDFSRMYFGRPQRDNKLYKSQYRPATEMDTTSTYYGVNDAAFISDLVTLYNDSVNPLTEAGQMATIDGYYARNQSKKNDNYVGDTIERHLPGGDLYDEYGGRVSVSNTPITDGVGALGKFTVSRGSDEHGDYLSYYDLWDLNGHTPITRAVEKYGLGKPYEIYDRIYGHFDGAGLFTPAGAIEPAIIYSKKDGGKLK